MTYSDHITTDTLADHAEGLLGESEAGKVAAHLEGCADCRSTALMLASLSEILAADDPGPMPAHYVARINSTLAELAIAEPVIPGQAAAAPSPAAPATPGGAQVIDLASRRKIMVTGLRRVGTVAAGVVLLITGAALGIQTLGNRSQPGPPSAGGEPAPAATVGATYTAEVFDIPKDAVQNKQGNYVGKDGTVYIPSSDKAVANKVLLPSGPAIVKDTSGNPIVIKPVPPAPVPRNSQSAATTPPAKPGHGGRPGPGVAPVATPPPSAAAPPATQPSTAPDSGQAVGPAVMRPKGPQADDQQMHATETERSTEGDPYVTQSGSVYSEDNFAAKVMDLVSDAEQHPGPNDNGRQPPAAGQPAPASAPVTDPAEPAAGPNDATTSQTTTTSKHFGTRREVTADYTAPTAAMQPTAHGPASFDVEARVLRCAALTHRQAIAGDDGFWGDRKATIVVVQSDNPNQVMGYVFYGECNQRGGPVTAQDSPWEQQVDKPGTQPTAGQPSATQPPAPQSTTPPKRVGDVTSSQTQIKSSDPATAPPSGARSIPPQKQLS